LLELLAPGQPVSGPELARRLGVSRAAVWKQIAGLREAGLDIQAGADGYRLVHPLQWLDLDAVRTRLPGAVRRRVGTLENHWQLDSTSSEIARRVATLRDRSFVFADWQRAGRGRRGREWLSPPATNLQFSCLKRFPSGYAALSGLSLVAGVAAATALEDCGAAGIALKWPNDLMHADAKLGGILVELGGEFMGSCHAIIGIGINLRVPAVVRNALERPCTDLESVCGARLPARNELAAALVTRLVAALDEFDAKGFPAFAQAWLQRDALAGRKLRVDGAHGAFDGVAAGVDARGALLVQTAAGMRTVDSAEVSVRPT
jgi:BirA family biotin operon repressor/biotin-[acetyl-CoA-carboxylase] ligase